MNRNFSFLLCLAVMIAMSLSAVAAGDVNLTDSSNLTNCENDCIQIANDTNSLGEDLNQGSKNQTELILPSNSIYHKGQYSITLRDSNSSFNLSNRTVNFTINGVDYASTTNDDGVALIKLNLAPGKYGVFVSFAGDDSYSSCNFTSNLVILPTIKAADITKYYKSNTPYGVTYYDSQGGFLANRWVTVTVNGKSYSQKTNSKGFASFNFNFKPGSYKVVATNPVTGYSLTSKYVILSTIVSGNLNKVAGNSKKFTAKFLKSSGKPLAKKYIKFKIKGKTYKVKTNKYGVAGLSLSKFKKGTYKVTCYNSDGLTKSNTVKIFKRKASTKLSVDSYRFLPGQSKKIKVKFSTALGDSSCSGKTIKITVNGKTYSKKTNDKGLIYFDLSFLKKGVFTIQCKYAGNKYFKASSSKSTVYMYNTLDTDVKVRGTSSFGHGAGTVLKVSYTAGGVPLPKKTVSVTVDGVTYTRTTDSNGIASITPIDLDVGRYSVGYETEGDSIFHGASGSFDINVFQRSPSIIKWACGSSFKDTSQTFKVLVTDSKGNHASGGTVKLTVDSETYYASVSSKGYATVKTNVAFGKYKVSFKFGGNNNYLSSSNSKSINVKLSKFGKGLNQKNAVGSKAYLKSSSYCKVGNSKVKALVKSLTKGLSDPIDKAKALFNYVRDNLDYSFYYNSKHGSTKTLILNRGNCVDHSHLLVAMYRTAGLNARYVHGYCHFKSGTSTGHVWTQVKIGNTWVCGDAISYGNSLGKINNWNTKSYHVYRTYSSLPF